MSDQPQPINFGGTGDLNMLPAETNEAVVRIAESGKAIADAWANARPRLDEDEQKVGTGFDELSAGFRERYNAMKPQLEDIAVGAAPNFHAMGASGNNIVMHYMELDHQQTDRLRKLE
jgi:hypothetical protein